MPLYVESLPGWTSVPDTFVSLFANQPGCFYLDRSHHPTAPFSIIGAGTAVSTLSSKSSDQVELPFDFRPHLVGVLNYHQEQTSGEFLSVDRALVFDHKTRKLYLVADVSDRAEFDAWYHAVLLRLALIGGEAASYELANPAATAAKLVADDSRETYLNKIELAQQHISAGDVYQLCLTTRLRGDYSGDPLSYFLRLRRAHPAPYAAFIRVNGTSYAAISPERLISVSGAKVTSSPIKGTRPRGEGEEQDRQLLAELAENPKERAENLMIVDLIRNDLARVCRPESVNVESLLAVKSYSTVHQLVSDISAELADGKTGFDALAALFPGGSMTGAPKIRAMQILSELESSPRGGYSGGIGWIGPDGQMDLGMVIRTAIFGANEVLIGIGGGITSDSEPELEHEEIRLKATALVSELSASVSW